MARGFVKKRGDVWYAYWRDSVGKQHAKSIGTRKKEAEAYVARMQVQVTDGTFRDIQKITFPQFAEQWIRDYAAVQVKPSTFARYQDIIRVSLIPFFGDVGLSSITTSQVQHYVATGLETGKAPATVQKGLVLLKGMLKRAVEWDYLKINPALPVKAPKIPHAEMDFLTPGEIRAFLNATDEKWKPFFFTAIFTGMRLGELLALQWSDIDWNSGAICVRRSVWGGKFQEPKSKNSIRRIGMSPTLIGILKDYSETPPESADELVFCTDEGKLLIETNIRNRVFAPTLKRAGLRKIRLHDLRHTYASLLINQGENLKYVQQQLGHASITTTVDRYGHLMPDAHRNASARLDESVFGENPLT